MSNLMYADMAISAFSKVGGYLVSKEESKLARSVQKFRNTMSALSAAQSENAITQNEIDAADNTAFSRLSLQVSSMRDQAAYDVEAAAAGIMGRSVDIGRAQLDADFDRAKTTIDRTDLRTRRQFGQQRQTVKLQQIYNKDTSVIPKPSLGNTLLDIGMSSVDIWDKHNPEDRQVSALLSRKRK
jgi:hypothetical protein